MYEVEFCALKRKESWLSWPNSESLFVQGVLQKGAVRKMDLHHNPFPTGTLSPALPSRSILSITACVDSGPVARRGDQGPLVTFPVRLSVFALGVPLYPLLVLLG